MTKTNRTQTAQIISHFNRMVSPGKVNHWFWSQSVPYSFKTRQNSSLEDYHQCRLPDNRETTRMGVYFFGFPEVDSLGTYEKILPPLFNSKFLFLLPFQQKIKNF